MILPCIFKSPNSCINSSMVLTSLLMGTFMIVMMINVTPIEARIDSKAKELDSRLLEDSSALSGDVQPASDALQHFLKELDRYVAIAGRPRFGRSAYKQPKSPSLLSDYLISQNIDPMRYSKFRMDV